MPAESPFHLFGPAHLWTLAGVAAVAVLLPRAARRWSRGEERRFAVAAAALLLLVTGAKIGVRVGVYGYPLAANLPLNPCGLGAILAAVMLLARSYSAYEVVYLWGLAGTLQALLTPDLDRGFPHPVYLLYFADHAAVVIFAVYGTVVYGFQPALASVPRVFAWSCLLALAVTPLNLAFDANYLYLMAKPAEPSLLDHLGPWPWYILGAGGLAVVSFLAYTAPFVAWRAWQRSRGEAGWVVEG